MSLRHRNQTRRDKACQSAWVDLMASKLSMKEITTGFYEATGEPIPEWRPHTKKEWARDQAPIVMNPVRKIKRMIRERSAFLIQQAYEAQKEFGVPGDEATTNRIDWIVRNARKASLLFQHVGSPIRASRHPAPLKRTRLPGRPALVQSYSSMHATLYSA